MHPPPFFDQRYGCLEGWTFGRFPMTKGECEMVNGDDTSDSMPPPTLVTQLSHSSTRPHVHTPSRFSLFLLLALAVAGFVALPAQAQERTEPFSTVELRVGGTSNVNRNFLHEFWKRGTGVELSFGTPFYLGFLEFGSALQRYEALGDVPGFGAVWLYAGWGLGVDVADRLRLEGSARIGNYHMGFDDAATEFAGVANESELAMMVNARVAVRAVGPVSIYVSGSYMQAYTFLRLKLWYASAGLSFRFKTPDGLKDFLQ